MSETHKTFFLSPASDYIAGLTEVEQATLAAKIQILSEGDTNLVHTKQLRGPIRELIMGSHRITYFILKKTLYFIEGFRKKTTKTPKNKIDFATKIYKKIKSQQ